MDQGNNTISAVDMATGTVTANIGTHAPQAMVPLADGSRAYVTNLDGNTISLIDTSLNTVICVFNLKNAQAIAAEPGTGNLYVGRAGSFNIMRFNTSHNLFTGQMYLATPRAMAVSPDGRTLYVADAQIHNTYMVDTSSLGLEGSVSGVSGDCMQFSPDGSRLYEADDSAGKVDVVDTASAQVINSVNVSACHSIALSPDGSLLYAGSADSGTVAVIETAGDTVTDSISAGSGIVSLALSPDGSRIYAANRDSGTVAVIDASSRQVVDTINVGGSPSNLEAVAVPDTVPFLSFPNGFSFPNFVVSGFSVADFLSTYDFAGKNDIDYTDPDTKAARFYQYFYRDTGEVGDCFGLATAELILFQHKVNAWNYNGSIPLPSEWQGWGYFVNGYQPQTVRDFIRYFQPLQFDQACLDDLNNYHGTQACYAELKSRMAGNWSQDPMVLGYVCNETDYGTGTQREVGHAAIPWKIQESSDGQSAIVYLSDPNLPLGPQNNSLEASPRLLVDLTNWETKVYGSLEKVDDMQLVSLSALSAPPQLPTGVVSLDGNFTQAHLVFTGDGGQLGYVDGDLVDSIPGTCPLFDYGGTRADNFEAYYLAGKNLPVQLLGASDGTANVSFYDPNGLITVTATVAPGSSDNMAVMDGGNGITFTSGSGTSALSLMVDSESASGPAHLVRVDTSAEAGSTMGVSCADGQVTITNGGGEKNVTLHLEQALTSPNSDEGVSVKVEAGSSVKLEPQNWDNIATGGILVEHLDDKGKTTYTETIGSIPALKINDFSASTLSGSAPLTVDFTSDVSGQADQWQWKFENGGADTLKVGSTTHTFKKPGTYTVSLRVKDKDGHTEDQMTKQDFINVK